MLDLKRIRPLDAAIAAVAALVILVGGWVAYASWSQNRSLIASTPASRAVDQYVAKVRKNPNDLDARMALAQALVVAGRDREALEQYQQVLKVRKDFVPALSGIGFIYMKRHDWDNGSKYFRRVVTLTQTATGTDRDPNLEVAHFYLGTALMEQKKYEEAVGHFKAALRLRRDASDTWYSLAVCYRELKNPDYEETLRATLAFDPKMPEANYDLGMFLLGKKDLAEAAERFRLSADAAPDVAKPRDELAKLGSAAEHLSKATSLEKTDAKKALVEARIAVALDPSSIAAQLLKGSLYEKTKDKEKAAEAYKAVLELDPGNADATAGLKRSEK